MKHISVLFFAALLAVVPAAAQQGQGAISENSIASIETAIDQCVEGALEFLTAEDRAYVGEITLNGNATLLGNMIRDMVTTQLVSNDIAVYRVASRRSEVAYELNSRLYQIGDSAQWLVDLIDRETNRIERSFHFVMELGERELRVLLQPVSGVASADGEEGYDAYEPNNIYNEAVEIYLDETMDELALTPGDEDWFYFYVEEAEEDVYHQITFATHSSMDTVMYIYGEDDLYGYLYYNDDGGSGTNAHISQIFAPGGYFLQVVGYSGGQGGSYRLQSTVETITYGALDIGEPLNNTLEGALDVEIASGIEAQIFPSDDVDWYRFEATDNIIGDVAFYTTGNTDTVIYIYDEYDEYNPIAYNDDSGEGTNASLNLELESGIYYIEVRGYGGGAGRYAINVEGEYAETAEVPQTESE